MGAMLEASAVDQLFLTISPKLIGGGPERSPLTDETDLLEREVGARLLSIRRSEDYLFLRYDLSSPRLKSPIPKTAIARARTIR